MVSDTTWVYAEMWMPTAGRLIIEATYVKPSKMGSLANVDKLSRSMALKPGICLPGGTWQAGHHEWHSDLQSSILFQSSPRMETLRQAALVSVSLPYGNRALWKSLSLPPNIKPTAWGWVSAVHSFSNVPSFTNSDLRHLRPSPILTSATYTRGCRTRSETKLETAWPW